MRHLPGYSLVPEPSLLKTCIFVREDDGACAGELFVLELLLKCEKRPFDCFFGSAASRPWGVEWLKAEAMWE